jgi:hypothetical protein
MLITKIQLAAMSRANLDETALKRIPNTYLYVDEFQNFANESFAEILSESRKYKLCLTVANQYVDQMTEEVRNAVIGNVGSFLAFRVGSNDAELMEKEFAPNFLAEDMVNLGFTQMYLKLMIDGIGSRPFSANSLPPIPKPEKSYVEDIVGFSRKHFSHERAGVEQNVKAWTNRDFNLENQKQNQVPKKEIKPEIKLEEKKVEYREDKKEPKKEEKPRGVKVQDPKIRVKTDEEKYEEVYGPDSYLIASISEKTTSARTVLAENFRRKALLNMQKVHALADKESLPSFSSKILPTSFVKEEQGNTSKKQDTRNVDEVPEDVLRALLNMDDL